MNRANLHTEIRARLLAGEAIAPDALTRYGVRAADVISAIRRVDLIPVARVPAPPECVTDPLTGKASHRSSRRTECYRVLSLELQRHALDRLNQAIDMRKQHENRQRRDLAKAAIDRMNREGLAEEIPETFLKWAALRVPVAGAGSSAPLIVEQSQQKQDVK